MAAQKKSQKPVSTARRALVLGPGTADTAAIIAGQLRALGFDVEIVDTIPSHGYLEDFSRKASAAGVPVLHPGVGACTTGKLRQAIADARQSGFSVLSPPVRVLTALGDKLNLLIEAEKLGILTPLLSNQPVHSVREIERFMQESGHSFPFVLRSVRDTGHLGYLFLRSAEELSTRFPLWVEQLRHRTGESIFFLERSIEGARRITVPFARFTDGTIRVFPKVDSSLQCRHRKLIEFCPTFGMDPRAEKELETRTRQIAEHLGYVGVGLAEYMVDGSRVILTEVLERLNTGFPLWERLAGTQAVAWQLATAESRSAEPSLEQQAQQDSPADSLPFSALLRIYAEDPVFQLPRPGKVIEISDQREWKFSGAAAALHLGVRAGETIPDSGNGTIGFLRVSGKDQKQLMTMARGVLSQVWIAGSLQTNERFLAELAAHPWVREGIFHADFIDEEFLPALGPPRDLLSLFVDLPSVHPGVKNESDARWIVGDQWVKPTGSITGWNGSPAFWEGEGGLPGLSGILDAGEPRQKLRVIVVPLAPDRWQIRVGEWVTTVRQVRGNKGALKLSSLVSGRIHSILFRPDSTVPPHEPLVIVESLGMLVPHALPVETRIIRWNVQAEESVHLGQELAEFQRAART